MNPPAFSAPAQPVPAASRWLWGGLAVVALGHACQLFSPLRLNHDSVRLLAMGWSAHMTGSYDVNGVPDQFPPGYPVMIRGLLAVGLGRTFWLNALNLGWLAVAATCWYWMARRQFRLSEPRAVGCVLVPLLSWVIVKHAALPLSDLPYLGLASGSLLCLQSFWLKNSGPAWFGALLLAVAAMQVRTIGIALVTTVFLTAVLHPLPRQTVIRIGRQAPYRLWLAVLLALGAGVVAFHFLEQTEWFRNQFLNPNSYFSNLTRNRSEDERISWLQILGFRSREIASISLNLPGSTRLAAVDGMIAVLALAGFAVGVRRVWKTHLPVVLFIGLTGCVLAAWPFADARFFLSLWPAACLVAASAYPDRAPGRSWYSVCATTYLAAYAMLGFAALGFSMRLTLAGRGMAHIYSEGLYRQTYLQAFGLNSETSHGAVEPDWLVTLQRFEPRANRPAASEH